MPKTIFEALGGAQNRQQNQQRNFAPDLLRHIQGFRGNPVQQLQDKINSGEMTQDQYSFLYQVAEGIAQKMFGVLGRR